MREPVRVNPHDFEPLRRFRNRGRCRVCLVHERHHRKPMVWSWQSDWWPSRAIGDTSEAITQAEAEREGGSDDR
jgi:hypothetical protein